MIIALTGRIAAGKETLTRFLVDKGLIYMETSRVLKDMLAEQGLEVIRKNMQDLGDKLRKEQGPGVLMKILLGKTEAGKDYIFDSLRNLGEAEFLRENVKDFFLIGVDAPQRLRFERLLKRNKPSDPKTWEDFLRDDERDYLDKDNPLGQQVGKVMENADFIIVNDGDLEHSIKRIEAIWEEIKSKTHKNI